MRKLCKYLFIQLCGVEVIIGLTGRDRIYSVQGILSDSGKNKAMLGPREQLLHDSTYKFAYLENP